MSKPVRVAVASRSFSRHPVLRAELSARYPDVAFNDAGRSLAGDELAEFLAGRQRIVTALERIDDALLDRLPDLEVIGKYGVGLDMIDMAALARRNIRLGWTGGVNRRAVAELTLTMMISLLRRVPAAAADARAGQWRQTVGRQLTGRTVGIVGCGHVGKDLVRLLAPFGCRVLAHDILDFPDFYAAHGVTPVGLETLLREADVVTLHTPLDASTRNILSAERLALLRPDAVLINAARGGLIDEAALKAMLTGGRLAAAGLDVLAVEPPEDLGLALLPNVLLTPHIGGSSEEAILAMGRAAIDGLENAAVPRPDFSA